MLKIFTKIILLLFLLVSSFSVLANAAECLALDEYSFDPADKWQWPTTEKLKLAVKNITLTTDKSTACFEFTTNSWIDSSVFLQSKIESEVLVEIQENGNAIFASPIDETTNELEHILATNGNPESKYKITVVLPERENINSNIVVFAMVATNAFDKEIGPRGGLERVFGVFAVPFMESLPLPLPLPLHTDQSSTAYTATVTIPRIDVHTSYGHSSTKNPAAGAAE